MGDTPSPSPVACFHSLPAEIIENLFGYLDPRDVKSGVLVNRRWRRYLSHKKYWQAFSIKLQGHLLEIFRSERFQLVDRIVIGNKMTAEFVAGIFQRLAKTRVSKDKCLNIPYGTNMSKVEPTELAIVVSSLRRLEILADLSTLQWDFILSRISFVSNSKVAIHSLVMAPCDIFNDPSEVNPFDLTKSHSLFLASALCSLHTVRLCWCVLSHVQVKVLMSTIANTSNLRLHTLDLSLLHIDRKSDIKYPNYIEGWDEVDSRTLARAVCKLHTVHLSWMTDLPPEQFSILFEMIANNSNCRLHSIDLRLADFSDVPKDILARALCKLHTVDILNALVTTEQMISILTKLVEIKNPKLRYLIMSKKLQKKVEKDLLHKAKMKVKMDKALSPLYNGIEYFY